MLLKAKYVFPVSELPIKDGCVVVHDNKIVEVGKSADVEKHYPTDETIDLGLAGIMPGFVNLHTRLERTILRGTVADEPYSVWLSKTNKYASRLETNDRIDSSKLGCLEAIRCGTTTVADIATDSGAYSAIQNSGLRGIVYREVAALEKNRVEFALSGAKEDIEKWEKNKETDRVEVGISPASPFQNHPKVFGACAKYANDNSLPLTIRLAGSLEEYNFIMRGMSMSKLSNPDVVNTKYVENPPWLPFGVSPVEYVKNWGAFECQNASIIHGIHVNEQDINTLKDYHVGICSCPASEAQLGMGATPVSEYIQAGIAIGFGTDSPAATEAADMLSELRFAMLLHRALNVKEYLRSSTVLRLGTLGGAKVLHMDDKIGTLQAGKLADIVAVDLSKTNQILDMNPVSALINSCTSANIILTMVDGNILFRDGKMTSDVHVDDLLSRLGHARQRVIK